MKLTTFALAAAVLTSCSSRRNQVPGARPEGSATDVAATAFDFSACVGRQTTLEEFVRSCQSVTALNFTYAEPTQRQLAAAELKFDGPLLVPREDLQSFLRAELAPYGLTCRSVGPTHLGVVAIEPSTAR